MCSGVLGKLEPVAKEQRTLPRVFLDLLTWSQDRATEQNKMGLVGWSVMMISAGCPVDSAEKVFYFHCVPGRR